MSNIAGRSTACKHQHRSSYTTADGSSKYLTETSMVLEYVASSGATASTTVPQYHCNVPQVAGTAENNNNSGGAGSQYYYSGPGNHNHRRQISASNTTPSVQQAVASQQAHDSREFCRY